MLCSFLTMSCYPQSHTPRLYWALGHGNVDNTMVWIPCIFCMISSLAESISSPYFAIAPGGYYVSGLTHRNS